MIAYPNREHKNADEAARRRAAQILVSFPRPADGTGWILACYPDGAEYGVGRVFRTENKPGSSRGWRAELWRDHPSKLPKGEPWAADHGKLAAELTEAVARHGEWWS